MQGDRPWAKPHVGRTNKINKPIFSTQGQPIQSTFCGSNTGRTYTDILAFPSLLFIKKS